ncbi:hypothetical protein [Lacihabitans sp. LS3-19]|uniref:hypothetical protein n=1 Tax=Lacihabitans sp. LS3-19 TaxID=2487335 RepID=UPI0020CCDE8C|nr:hypothetical protein [Lacihabitans sp. LS3-19]
MKISRSEPSERLVSAGAAAKELRSRVPSLPSALCTTTLLAALSLGIWPTLSVPTTSISWAVAVIEISADRMIVFMRIVMVD